MTNLRHRLPLLCALFATALAWAGEIDSAVVLLRHPSITPGPAVISDKELYFSEHQEKEGCPAKDLYSWNPAALKLTLLAEIACVASLQRADGRVLIEARRDGKSLWRVWDGKSLVDLEESNTGFSTLWPQLRLGLFALGRGGDKMAGHWLRKAPLHRVIFRREPKGDASYLFLLSSPEKTPDLSKWIVGSADAKKLSAVPKLAFLSTDKTDAILDIHPASSTRAFAIVQSHNDTDPETPSPWISLFDVGNGKPISQWNGPSGEDQFRALRSLVATAAGAAVFVDEDPSGNRESRLWHVDPASEEPKVTTVPARDIIAISASGIEEGILISRRAGIEWWGPKNKLPDAATWAKAGERAQSETKCGTMRVQADGTDGLRIFASGKIWGEALEWVEIARAKGVKSWACSDKSVALAAQELLPRLTPGRLGLKVTASDRKAPNASNVRDALTLDAKRSPLWGRKISAKSGGALFLLTGNTLWLAREPFSGTSIDKVERIGDLPDDFEVHLKESDSKEAYTYNWHLKGGSALFYRRVK